MYVYTYFLIQVTRLDTSSSSILENTTQTATEVFYITHNNHTWHHHNTGPAWDSGQLSLAGSSATPGAQVHLQLFFYSRVVLAYMAVFAGEGSLGGCGSVDNGGGGEGGFVAGAGGLGRNGSIKHLVGCAALPQVGAGEG